MTQDVMERLCVQIHLFSTLVLSLEVWLVWPVSYYPLDRGWTFVVVITAQEWKEGLYQME